MAERRWRRCRRASYACGSNKTGFPRSTTRSRYESARPWCDAVISTSLPSHASSGARASGPVVRGTGRRKGRRSGEVLRGLDTARARRQPFVRKGPAEELWRARSFPCAVRLLVMLRPHRQAQFPRPIMWSMSAACCPNVVAP